MSSTTTAPAEPGTTYPMPPAPSWATGEPDLTEGSIGWDHILSNPDDPFAVGIRRSDRIQPHGITVGGVDFFIESAADGGIVTPAQVRRFAALLVEAADLAEQS